MKNVVSWLLSRNSKFERLDDDQISEGTVVLLRFGSMKLHVVLGCVSISINTCLFELVKWPAES